MSSANNPEVASFLESALQEGLALLASASFNIRRGYYSQGSLTAVSVTVRPHAVEVDTVSIQIICYAAGHLNVYWDGVPIILLEHNTGDERLAFLNAQGR